MRSLALFLCLLAYIPVSFVSPFVGVLLWSWFSFMNPHREAWGFATDLPWAMIIAVATVIGCVVAREPKRPRLHPTAVTMLLFMALFSIAALFALAPDADVFKKWDLTIKVFAFCVLTSWLVTTRERMHALVWVMALSLGFYGARGGAFALVTGGGHRVFGPPATMIYDNNHIAAALLVALPLMNYLRLESAHRWVRIGLTLTMMLSLAAVLASYSRGALVGLLAVAAFFWWNSRRKLVTLVVMVPILALGITLMPAQWLERMHSIGSYSADDSAQGRLNIWGVALEMAVARPLVGGGFTATYRQDIVDHFGPDVRARAVHSIYFEVLGENGFPAFFIWCLMIAIGIANTLWIRRQCRGRGDLEWASNLARMAQVSIIAYLTAGAFLSLGYWDFFFTLLALLAAVRIIVAREVVVGTNAEGPVMSRPMRTRQPALVTNRVGGAS